MTVVFRIRTAAGQELSFASREMFEDFVRSGDLSPDDLVYDGETGSWSPARTNAVVLDIQYALEEAAEAAASAGEAGEEEDVPGDASDGAGAAATDTATSADTAGSGEADPDRAEEIAAVSDDAAAEGDDVAEASPTLGGAGLEFDLALTEELTPEDEQRVFLEQLEAEKQDAFDAGPSLRESLSDFQSDTLAPRDEPPPPPPTPERAPPPSRPRPQRPTPRERASAASTPTTPTPATSSGGAGRMLMLLVVLGILVGGGYAGYSLWSAESEPDLPEPDVPQATLPGADPVESEPEPEPVVTEPEPEPEPTPEAVIPDTPAAVRERAQERYLAATQTELRSLQPIPEIWPEGPYLTVPSDHPEVVDVWQDYRATIREVRQADADRYRAAFEAALDDAAVTGDARQARLASGMEEFGSSEELRAAHFDRVEALATAAIQSHNALVEAEGLILFDATGSTGRASGIGAGTSGRNAEAQLLLDQVIELLEDALDADGEGPGSGENVREWVWGGFLDAITR